MAAYTSFGTALRQARERRGYDLATTARRLRIRPDILQAIESADFSHMPPRGYARNMVNAYARFVGLNPTEITQMYLDEARDWQHMRARETSSADAAFDMGPARRGGRSGREQSSRRQNSRQGASSRPSRERRAERQERSRGSWGSKAPSAPSAPRTQFTNFYSGPASPSTLRSKLPFLLGGAVVLVVLIVVLSMVFSNKQPVEETTPMPISGLTDTSDPVTDTPAAPVQAQQPQAVAPDKVVFSYSVAAGASAYIEVYEDGSPTPSVAETVAGPTEKSFDVTGALTFVTSNPESVSLTLADEVVSTDSLVDAGGGVYTYAVDFASYLSAWNEEHATSAAPAASGSAGA